MSNNLSRHTLGLTELQSGQGVPSHQSDKGSFYIDVLTSNFYKNIDGSTSWQILVTTGSTDNYVTGGIFTGTTLTLYQQNGSVQVTGFTSENTYVTGFTYNDQNKITLSQNNGESDLFVYLNQFSGLTVNGNVSINGSSLPNGYALSVTGDTNFIGDVYVQGDLTYQGNLLVTGGTTIQNGLTANTIYTDYIDFNFNTGLTITQSQGRVSWDTGTGTLNITVGDSDTGLIDLQVGQEEIVRVYNAELTDLLEGEVVYVVGNQGNRPSVKRALATSDGYSVTTLGVVDSVIVAGTEGYVTTFGIISNLNTNGLTGGTPIFLSPTTPGAYTSIKPQAPNHIVLLGYVVRPNSTNAGSIFVNINNGWELDELHDVRVSGVTTGDLLMRSTYNGSNVWVNTKNLIGNYTVSDSLSATTFYGSGVGLNNVPISGVTNLQNSLDLKTNLSLFNLHTGNTSNPHQTSFSQLISTAHTHTILDVIDLQTSLDSKFNKSGGTVNGSVNISGTLNVGTIISGTPVGNIGFNSNGQVVSGSSNATVENFYYSISNSVDTRPIFEDSKVLFNWDETGNQLEFQMKVAPGGSGDMRSLGYIVGGATQNTAIVSTGINYDVYAVGVSPGNRLEVFISAENDVTYPAYYVVAYNTGESFQNTIWIQRITKN